MLSGIYITPHLIQHEIKTLSAVNSKKDLFARQKSYQTT